MLRIRVLIALLAAGLIAPGAALAHRTSNPARTATPAANSSNASSTTAKPSRATIVAAAVHQGEISAAQGACVTVTVSSVNSGYASLTWPAKLSKQCKAVAANGTIIEAAKGSSWFVVAAGSSFACPLQNVPANVASSLGVCG